MTYKSRRRRQPHRDRTRLRANAQRSASDPSDRTEIRPANLRGRYRKRLLRLLVQATHGFQWTPGLIHLLLEELYVEDDIIALLGAMHTANERRIPQMVAVAIALRHSWRVDDFYGIVRRLNVTTHVT